MAKIGLSDLTNNSKVLREYTNSTIMSLAKRPEVLDMGDYYRVAGYSRFYRVSKQTLLATEEE